jgi:hypothetical protein
VREEARVGWLGRRGAGDLAGGDAGCVARGSERVSHPAPVREDAFPLNKCTNFSPPKMNFLIFYLNTCSKEANVCQHNGDMRVCKLYVACLRDIFSNARKHCIHNRTIR